MFALRTLSASLLVAALAAVAPATVLTFDIGTSGTPPVPQDYGDNVTATTMGTYSYGAGGGFTPDVTVDYVPVTGNQAYLDRWDNGFSDLTNVVEYEPDGVGPWSIRFNASGGNLARLESFDLGNFGGAVTLPSLTVRDGSGNVLWSMSNIAVPDRLASHLTFSPNVAASTLLLTVDQSTLGGDSDNIGLDNIRFSQAVAPVPEPSAFVALGLGAVVLLRRRRR